MIADIEPAADIFSKVALIQGQHFIFKTIHFGHALTTSHLVPLSLGPSQTHNHDYVFNSRAQHRHYDQT